MAPRKKKLSKEEILQRKREAERKRYQRIKNDPQKRDELREKERLKYIKKKEKGTRKLVENMTPREHREAKKKWKNDCTKYRNKKKVLKNITNLFVKENTPDSDTSNIAQRPTPEVIRKQSNRDKLLRYKIIKKKKDEEIKALKTKVLKYKKRLSRLKIKEKTKDTPNTKIQKLAILVTPECRKDLVKKALFIFLKLCDNKGKIFRVDQDDIADVTTDQVVQKLPNPNIYLKGNRIFYKFDTSVDVFEKQ